MMKSLKRWAMGVSWVLALWTTNQWRVMGNLSTLSCLMMLFCSSSWTVCLETKPMPSPAWTASMMASLELISISELNFIPVVRSMVMRVPEPCSRVIRVSWLSFLMELRLFLSSGWSGWEMAMRGFSMKGWAVRDISFGGSPMMTKSALWWESFSSSSWRLVTSRWKVILGCCFLNCAKARETKELVVVATEISR